MYICAAAFEAPSSNREDLCDVPVIIILLQSIPWALNVGPNLEPLLTAEILYTNEGQKFEPSLKEGKEGQGDINFELMNGVPTAAETKW